MSASAVCMQIEKSETAVEIQTLFNKIPPNFQGNANKDTKS